MEEAELPADEVGRLALLYEHAVLDTPPEAVYDESIDFVCDQLGVAQGAVTLVDRDRQWFKARHGELPHETPRRVAFCAHAILGDDLFEVPDARLDARFADNPLVVGPPHIRFYAGRPLRSEGGARLGTVCVIDPQPRKLSPSQRRLVEQIAREIEANLRLRLESARLAARLATVEALERDRAELVTFIAHDLRSPLAAVVAGADLLRRRANLGQREELVLDDVREAAELVARMARNLVDVTGASEGGLVAQLAEVDVRALVAPALRRAGLRAAADGGRLELRDDGGPSAARLDAELVGRMLENLLDNALHYGTRGGRIEVGLGLVEADRLEITVTDDGPGIPAGAHERVFERSVRLSHGVARTRSGRGLGLAFCRLAVEAHGGTIRAEEVAPRGARFVASLPREPRPLP